MHIERYRDPFDVEEKKETVRTEKKTIFYRKSIAEKTKKKRK